MRQDGLQCSPRLIDVTLSMKEDYQGVKLRTQEISFGSKNFMWFYTKASRLIHPNLVRLIYECPTLH